MNARSKGMRSADTCNGLVYMWECYFQCRCPIFGDMPFKKRLKYCPRLCHSSSIQDIPCLQDSFSYVPDSLGERP